MTCRLFFTFFVLIFLGCKSNQNTPLRLLSGAGPIYPENIQESGIQGHVVLHYDVDTKGEVTNIRITESVPSGVFDSAAVSTLRSWRFSPEVLDGVKQRSPDVRSKISFSLSGASKER